MHFQKPPFDQTKLVRVISGEVLDVVVDLRKSSLTFGNYFSVLLSAENKQQLLIPRGFAHGFLVLSEIAIFSYKVDNPYSPKHDAGIIWNDPDLNIDWKMAKKNIQLSKKDQELTKFQEFQSPFE